MTSGIFGEVRSPIHLESLRPWERVVFKTNGLFAGW